MFICIESYLPHPVTDICRTVDNCEGIVCSISVGLVHIEHTIINNRELLAVQVTQDRTIAFIDVDDVEVEPVGHLVVGMSCGIAYVDLVLTVRLIFGIRTGTRALYNLLGAKIEAAVTVLVGHRETGDGRMPVDAAPAQIDVLRVVAEDKRRRVCSVVGSSQSLLITQ